MTLFSKLIIGTNGADKITATDESHLILADGGDDTITSGSGNDFIFGGLVTMCSMVETERMSLCLAQTLMW